MVLLVQPPVAPMLAALTREIPDGDYFYEPKWDGFRCLAFREGSEVDLRSRHDRPLSRYFPELVEALVSLPVDPFVLDGEIVHVGPRGFDFASLMMRLHPAASRVELLRHTTPAAYIAFDALQVGEELLVDRPFADRRAALESVLRDPRPPVFLTPITRDRQTAERWYASARGGGVDGIVAKDARRSYAPGRRVMVKVKHERTADCVVAGMRLLEGQHALSSLILGLYDDTGALRHVGVVTAFPAGDRITLLDELAPLAIPLADHPWRDGFLIGASPLGRLKGSASRWLPGMEHDWVPLRPERVVEVAFDQVDVDRFRHAARFRRWRPDRDPRSCLLDQIRPDPTRLGALLAS